MMRRPALLACLLTTCAFLGAATPALAAKDLRVGMADDGVLQRTAGLGAQIVPEWRAAGVDAARVLVIWHYVAPGSDRITRPADFDPANPNDPQYNWGPVDEAINLLRANGIEPIITVTGWNPLWGTLEPQRRSQSYRPDPKQFAVFAGAVAARYRDQANEFMLWNEPNISQWLAPQYDRIKGKYVPSAPHQYRAIARLTIPAIKAANPAARIYGPGLASQGFAIRNRNTTIRPIAFLRALGCVTTAYRPDRKTKACRGFKPASLDGIAHHPHFVFGTRTAPTDKPSNPDDATFASYGPLTKALDRIQKAGGLLNGGSKTKKFDLYYDELAYQTNPPDPVLGVSAAKQAAYLQQIAYLAYRQPRVKLITQYLWRDDPTRDKGSGSKRYSGWQSGLYFFDGRAKPSAQIFPNPLWVELPRGKKTASVWGQVRPGGASEVVVEKRTGSGSFATLSTLTTDARGYFALTAPVTGTTAFRYRYKDGDRTVVTPAQTVKPVKGKAARRR